jgi:glycerol uptake facilitator protein
MKRAITELIGTFVLVFLGTGAVVTVVTKLGFLGPTGGDAPGLVPGGLLLIGLAFGFAVLVMIYAFGHISGTHINPVVSICLWATGRFPAKDMLAYVVMQLIGATLASLVVAAIWGQAAIDAGLGITLPGADISYGVAILVELVTTAFLVLVIWGSAVDSRAPSGFAGVAIGIVVAADIMVTGPIAGASMNTARSFGPFWPTRSWAQRLLTALPSPIGPSSPSTSSARSWAASSPRSSTTTSRASRPRQQSK